MSIHVNESGVIKSIDSTAQELKVECLFSRNFNRVPENSKLDIILTSLKPIIEYFAILIILDVAPTSLTEINYTNTFVYTIESIRWQYRAYPGRDPFIQFFPASSLPMKLYISNNDLNGKEFRLTIDYKSYTDGGLTILIAKA